MIKPKKEKQSPYKFQDNFVKPKPPPPPVVETPPPPVVEPKKNTLLDALKGGLDTFRAFSHGVSEYVPIVKTADTAFGRNEGLTPEQIGQKYSLQSYLGREPTTIEKIAQGVGGFLPWLIGGALAKTPLQMMGIGGATGALGGYGGGTTPTDVLVGGIKGAAFVPGMHYATKATSSLLGKVAPKLANTGLQGFAKGVATDIGGAVGGTTASTLASAPLTGQLLPSSEELESSILANVALNRAGAYLANRQMKGQQATPPPPPTPPPTETKTSKAPPTKMTKSDLKTTSKLVLPVQEPLPKPIEPLPKPYEKILAKKVESMPVLDRPIATKNLQNIPQIPQYEQRFKIPEPIKLSPEILQETTPRIQERQPNLLENRTSDFADLQQKLDLLRQTKPTINETQQNTVISPQKTQDMTSKIIENIKPPTAPNKGINREILSTTSSTGKVERVGDFVYKPTTNKGGTPTLESEVYKALKNVEGVAKGTTVKRGENTEIKTPYYKKVISVDTVPKQERTSLANIIEPSVDRINKAINELSNKNYSYSDPLQFGVNKEGKLELMDFSNVSKGDKYFNSATDNYDRLAQFYKEFGLEKQANIIDEGMRLKGLSEQYTKADIAKGDHLMPKEDVQIINQIKAKGDIKSNNVYYTTSEKPIKMPKLGQTELIDGVRYVYTEKPIPEKRLNELGLKKIYEESIKKVLPTKKEKTENLESMVKNENFKREVNENLAEKPTGEIIPSKDFITEKPTETNLESMLKGIAKPISTKKGFENFTKSDIARYKKLVLKERGQIESSYSKLQPKTKEEATNLIKEKQKEIKFAEKIIKEKMLEEINKRNPNNDIKKKINNDGTVEEKLEANIKFMKEEPPKYKYTYEKPDFEETHQKYYGIKQETFLQQIKKFAINTKKGFTNPIKEINTDETNAEAVDAMLHIPKVKSQAIDETERALERIVKNLSFEENNVLNRKIQLDDMIEDTKRELPLPHSWTPKDVQNELKRIESHITPEVKKGLKKYRVTFNKAKEEYIKASEDLGIPNMREILDREMYFRHMILTQEGTREVKPGGGKSSVKISTNRSFLQPRKGGAITNTNYLEPSFEVLWQMKNDTLLMKELKRIEGMSIHEQVKQDAKMQKIRDWKELIPKGYMPYQFKDENFFFLTRSIPEELVMKLTENNLHELGLPLDPKLFQEVLATGRKGNEWVIPEEIAIGLEKMGTEAREGRGLWTQGLGKMKEWQLYKNPKNFLKYNIRNQTGDTDLFIRNMPELTDNPVQATKEATKLLYGSAKEIVNAYKTGRFTKNLRDYYKMGGWQILSDIYDVNQVSQHDKFSFKNTKFELLDTPKKVIDGYVTMVRDLTQMREMTNRYAMYKYILAELKASPNGLPKDYRSSKPEIIKGLKTLERRAFKMSNDALLDYGYVSEYGKKLARTFFPYFRFPEANLRSTIRFVANAFKNPKALGKIGHALGRYSAETAQRVGKAFLRMVIFPALVATWNILTQGDNPKDVPDDVKKRLYATFYKNSSGETRYFSNMGALSEVGEWFGLGGEMAEVELLLRGEITPKEWLSIGRLADKVKEAPKDVANKLTGLLGAHIKVPVEFISGKKFFPDVFNPIDIKDRGLYLAESLNLGDEYKYLTGMPSKSAWDILNPMNLATYKATGKKSAYDSVNKMVRKYLESIGKATKGYSENERSEALYYYKQAMKLKDKTATDKYLKKYFELGGTRQGLTQALKNLHPLAGMTARDRQIFMSKLTEKEREKVNLAIEHYKDLMTPPN